MFSNVHQTQCQAERITWMKITQYTWLGHTDQARGKGGSCLKNGHIPCRITQALPSPFQIPFKLSTFTELTEQIRESTALTNGCWSL